MCQQAGVRVASRCAGFSRVFLVVVVMTSALYAADPRLVLWNRLGSESEILTSEVGPPGAFSGGSFVPGRFGDAYSATHTEDHLVSFPKESIPRERGTIEFWAKLSGFGPNVPSGLHAPYFVGFDDGPTRYEIGFNSNDGASNGGLVGRVGSRLTGPCGGFTCGTGFFGGFTYAGILGSGEEETWHHYALVWDSNGIAGVADGTKKILCFLDGELNTGRWFDCPGASFQPLGADTLDMVENNFSQGTSATDNIKIWDFAKTDFSDRFVEGVAPFPCSLEFARQVGGGADVALDASGNIYVAGGFNGTADFDMAGSGFHLTADGSTDAADAFVACYDSSGDFRWAIRAGGMEFDRGSAIALDAAGNVYVAGSFDGTAEFDAAGSGFTLPSVGPRDAFLASYDDSGNFRWALQIGGEDFDHGFGVAVDTAGDIYVTGGFDGTADFDMAGSGFLLTALVNREEPGAGFVASYDSFGSFQWAIQCGGLVGSVVADASGNVYLAVGFWSMAEFDAAGSGFTLASPDGQGGGAVASYDSSGVFRWATLAGGSVRSVVVGPSGKVYLTGSFYGPAAEFDAAGSGFTLSSAGENDAYLACYDTSGSFHWATPAGGTLNDSGDDVAVDALGNAYVAGEFRGTAEFDSTGSGFTLSSAGENDAFLACYDSSGSFQWAFRTGGTFREFSRGVAADASGNIHVTGSFNVTGSFGDTVDFDPGPGTFELTSSGNDDGFLAKYACDQTPVVINDSLVLSAVDTSFSFAPCAASPANQGTFTIEAAFVNASAEPFSDLLFQVTTLTGGNVLCNADDSAGGVGSTLTVPLEGVSLPETSSSLRRKDLGQRLRDARVPAVDVIYGGACRAGRHDQRRVEP